MDVNSAESVRLAALRATSALLKARQKPTPKLARAYREEALIDGLMAVAEAAGASLERPMSINARGEIELLGGRQGFAECRPFGRDFADLLSAVPRRLREFTSEPCPADTGWCILQADDLERLLQMIAKDKHPALPQRVQTTMDSPAP